jgi:DNA-binding transcriptional MerR regulator
VGEHMQIGEVAERTGLSLRTIRYYEEVGLVAPSARSQGGFRLYTEPDVARLQLAKRMKPLGFQLDEMRELIGMLHPETGSTARGRKPGKRELERLREYTTTTEQRCAELRVKLQAAEEFATALRDQLDKHTTPSKAAR